MYSNSIDLSLQHDIRALMATRKVCYSVNDLSSSININNSLYDKNNKTSGFLCNSQVSDLEPDRSFELYRG